MTQPLRVLVVDDSVVVRRLVGDALSHEPGISLAGTASDGRAALAKIAASPPDVVILDIEMPELDGLATLAAIRRVNPNLPVVMFSTLTQRAAAATIEALTLGASDYVTKPEGQGSIDNAKETIRNQLVPKIRALCKRDTPEMTRRMWKIPPPAPNLGRAEVATAASVVAIGVSTGGPPALQTLLTTLPPMAAPILIVQHMPPDFTSMLAKRLSAVTHHKVAEARDGDRLAAGGVWIAPGDFHLRLETAGDAVVLRTEKGPPENSCRPAVDVLFRSVADVYGARVLGVVMTGMGQDGLRGAEYIKQHGGAVIVQDEATSVVWGMPGAVARAQLADAITPLPLLSREIVRRATTAAPVARSS